MSILNVSGARLYYETHGSGPLLLMVPGANGDADIFKMVTDYLADHYTVVTYDRRGFSRSQLEGPQDYDRRLKTEADDVRRLIEHLSDEPATVFGSSSGAIVVLEVLIQHPSVVRALVPHEPPAFLLLPDGQQWVESFSSLYDLYRQSGIEPAFQKFAKQALTEPDQQALAQAMDPRNSEYVVDNVSYWFEHELRQYPEVEPDLDALEAHADRILPVAGWESRGRLTYEVNRVLANKLGRSLVELPGAHLGYVTQPDEFARALVQTLADESRMKA